MKNLQSTPVAIVGMGGIFPAAPDSDTLWHNVINKISSVCDVPENRWITDAGSMVHSSHLPDKAISKRCCLIHDFKFNPEEYGMDPDFIRDLDLLYHLILHAGKAAIENLPSLNRERTGVILSAIALPTDTSSSVTRKILGDSFEIKLFNHSNENQITRTQSLAAKVTGLPGALLARCFGFGMGSYTLDAACASSIYAVKLACDELISNRADSMLAGGVSRPECLYTQVGFSQLRALSPSGVCAPFDKNADGLVVGEGAGILVLKRLDDALKEGDSIYGVIRGIGLSNDMRGNILAPDSEGQIRAMRMAYETSGLSPEDMDLIECHGAGTPVGDATELNSLLKLWENSSWVEGQCAIGSIKSMTGHLLTAAGAAGIIKTLLALKHKTLPPSLNFNQAHDNSPLNHSPFHVQKAPEEWERRQKDVPRRAAVSAFGFGGINGHILIEEFTHDASGSKTNNKTAPLITVTDHKPVPLAIIGMDTVFGSVGSLRDFQETILNGRSIIGKRPENRWKGCDRSAQKFAAVDHLPGGYFKDLTFDINDFHIPPKEIPDIIPQHLLMLKTAAGAMQNASLPLREERPRMGVIIGMEFDFEATNFHMRWNLNNLIHEYSERLSFDLDQDETETWLESLKNAYGPPLTPARTLGALGGIIASRIAREFCFGGPSFTVSAGEASGLRALEIGIRSLQQNETDAFLIGAVDLFGDIRSIITTGNIRTFSKTGAIRPFDQSADGILPGEGAAAIVLKRLDQAISDKDRIYAVIKGTGKACESGIDCQSPSPEAVVRSLEHCFKDSDIDPDSVSYIEAHGSGDILEDKAEANALHDFFKRQNNHSGFKAAIGSVKPNIGHTGAVSGLASLIKTALCLYQEIIPPLINFSAPADKVWNNKQFHVPVRPSFWFRNRKSGPRRACINSITPDGNCSSVVLEGFEYRHKSEYPKIMIPERNRPLGLLSHGLFTIEGDDQETLLAGIKSLSRHIDGSRYEAIEILAYNWHRENPLNHEKNLAIAIIADRKDRLKTFLQEAETAVVSGVKCKMNSRGGIRYSPSPIGNSGQIAFVYPGSGNHYIGMGRGVGIYWPEILRQMDLETPNLKSQCLPHIYNPERTSWKHGWEHDAHRILISDPLNMIFGQVVHGGVMTRLVNQLGITPSAVIGYSLGETAGFFANKAWPDRDVMLKRMQSTDLFSSQLSGPCLSARKAWNITDDEPFSWTVAVINRSAERIKKTLKNRKYVRHLISNTPAECVIGGRKTEVEDIINEVRCDAFFLNGVVTVHCDAAGPVADAYKELHVFPTVQPENISFYSCAFARKHELSSEGAASSILAQAVSGFDFPAVIKQAYQDGVRIFLEMGPSSSCTRMISRILHSKPHFAVSACSRTEDDSLTLLKFISSLISERRRVTLDGLYHAEFLLPARIKLEPQNTTANRIIRIPVGGTPIAPATPNFKRKKQIKRKNPDLKPAPVADEVNITASGSQDHHLTGRQKNGHSPVRELISQVTKNIESTANAHNRFLEFSNEITKTFEKTFSFQTQLFDYQLRSAENGNLPSEPIPPAVEPVFSREMCMEFATGSIAKVLGPDFSIVDTYPVRVRLPDEPLMLVDRILSIEGDPMSLGPGCIVTEHDVFPGAWYLDGGHAPVCISVEAGQADLFLCSYLGIDHNIKGKRTYRLLDATVSFHRELPKPGEIIKYVIHIDRFVQQGETYLFFFRFNGFIGNHLLITMTNGCAGFFTEEEVENSGGIILPEENRKIMPGIKPEDWNDLVPFSKEAYDDKALNALRDGNLSECFGHAFEGKNLSKSLHLPKGRMKLIDRILNIDPVGGRYQMGMIKAEADIHPDDWFITCHFVDDMVMPGTLMYECCTHALRVFLQRLGWITDKQDVFYEPVLNVESVLKCRGPVTPETKHVMYEIEIKEIGYAPEPYVIADAHMYADGHYIVCFEDMSMKMSGITRKELESSWGIGLPDIRPVKKKVLFDKEKLLEFATGTPSKALGERFKPYDNGKFIARLPAPPYSFIDSIVSVESDQTTTKAGDWIEAEYEVNPDSWVFKADRTSTMPYCVLNEIALQACGWLAAYRGSALKYKTGMRFRNLGGNAIQHREIFPEKRNLTIKARMTKESEAGNMIIEYFDFQVLEKQNMIYEGNTHFGFFTKDALAQQEGLRNAVETKNFPNRQTSDTAYVFNNRHPITPDDPEEEPKPGLVMPAKALRMIDSIETYLPEGGPHGLGFIRGLKHVDPKEWFFKAHFYQDPVCPGSLGIESFIQVIKYMAMNRWNHLAHSHRFSPVIGSTHEWIYRGQILTTNRWVEVETFVTKIEDGPEPVLFANGYLKVDGLYIYKVDNFGLKLARISHKLSS